CVVYIDSKKPVVSGVKNGEDYESKVNIKVSDKVSGVASVTLNGKKMSNKFTVSEAGDYKLVAKDKCNNKTVVNFSVIEDEPEETPDVVTAEPNPEDFETPSPEPTEEPNGGTVVIGGTSTPVATSATTTDAPKGTATPNVKTTASPAPTAKETEKPETATATPTMAPTATPTVVPATPTPVPDDLAELDANWKYTIDAQNKKIQLDKYIGNSPDVTVKGHYYIEGYSVPAKLKKSYYVVSDESVCTFYGPFADNKDIKTVTFMDGYVIENDDTEYLFYGCSSLEKVNGFEGTYTSLWHTFCGCTKFNQEFTIPADVKDLGFAFDGCETLEKMPKISKLSKCKSMVATFRGCKNMIAPSNFEFPVGVSGIICVFEGCEKLYIENLKIPDSVLWASDAFRGCKLLKSAEIGSPNSELQSVDSIFENCTSLTNVRFYFGKNMNNFQGALKGCSPGVNV
ncbi:leucine-rich repeat protein, partial [Ruminococcus sp.]|uniref:leucine-rich repeat protein n=1 Tax=Ruminococcus sp. TaxID=41978 RepID=UPI002E806F7A